jgi:hypothetical protein
MICLAADTARLCQHRFDVRSVGQVKCKGFRGLIEAFELRGSQRAKSRWEARLAQGLSPFINRDTEIAAVRAGLLRTLGGRGGFVVIRGESCTRLRASKR